MAAPDPAAPAQTLDAAEQLGSLTRWCLDHLDAPTLIGITSGPTTVTLDPIELDADDPVAHIAELVAPTEWDSAILLLEIVSTFISDPALTARAGVAAVAVSRDGSSHVELRSDGISHRLADATGLVMTTASALFDPLHPAPSQAAPGPRPSGG